MENKLKNLPATFFFFAVVFLAVLSVRVPAVLHAVDRRARSSDVLIPVKHSEALSRVVRFIPVVNTFLQVHEHRVVERVSVESVLGPRKIVCVLCILSLT